MEKRHMSKQDAQKMARVIREKSGVFIGTPDWCESNKVSRDDFDAFLAYAVRYAGQLDWLDSHEQLPPQLTTKATIDKFSGDHQKTTFTMHLSPSHRGDLSAIQRFAGELLIVQLYPEQMPLLAAGEATNAQVTEETQG